MNQTVPRYNEFPGLSDTLEFFTASVPFTNQSHHHPGDSVREFYNFSIYDYHTPKSISRTEAKPGPTMFITNRVAPDPGVMKPVSAVSSDWITIVLVLCLAVLAWIQTNYAKRLKQILRSVALPYYVNQLEREGNLYNERITLGLGFIFINAVAIILFLSFRYYGMLPADFSHPILYLLVLAGVLVFVLLKSFVIRLSGIVFQTTEYAHAYRLNSLIFNHATGIALVPLIFIINYWKVEPFLWIAYGIILISLIYRLIRSIRIGFSNTKYSAFYLILYLCTLEILPLLMLVKLIGQI